MEVKWLRYDSYLYTGVHENLRRVDEPVETYVLPLGHMSTQFYGAQILKEEYIARLVDGVKQWNLE